MYIYTNLSDPKVTMQADAARDAHARAEQIVTSSGCRVGRLRFVHIEVPQIPPAFATSESDGGVDDTTSLDKKITAIVIANDGVR